MPAIDVTDIVKQFDGTTALDRVKFQVREGTFFGCFGPNGAGKTTLLRILTGQLLPTSGQAHVLGMDATTQGEEIKRAIGLVPEVESPPSYLTAQEFLLFVCRIRGVEETEPRIQRWLEFFDLDEARGTLCKDLSKGMRQKVMLAAAFIHEPELLFLDEPFINLDPIYQRKLRDYLIHLKDEGRTIFLCSHILEIAERLCEEVIILSRGRIMRQMSLEEMRSRGESLESVFLRYVGGGNDSPP
jgi:ABC-2 type transport system ATP-binding protein